MNSEMLIQFAKEEYFSLRAEAVATVERQYSIANWCISSLAILFAGLIGGWGALSNSTVLLPALFFLLIPGITTAYISTWTHVISKLNVLGLRLHEIEENLAKAISIDLIRATFQLPSTDATNPYHYLLGWEHKLWKDGTHNRIKTTVSLVKWALLLFYCITIVVGAVVLFSKEFQSKVFPALALTAVFALWFVVWLRIAGYLQKSMSETG